MTKRKFSKNWKQSTQARKQRKYRFNAPLHIKQKFMHVHLSKELRAKYGTRAVQLRKGDKVKVTRGQYNKKEGKIDHIDLKRERVFVVGVEMIKKSGSKIQIPFHPSNLVIVELELGGDKYRKEKLEMRGKKQVKPAKKISGVTTEKREEKREEKKEEKKESVIVEGTTMLGKKVKKDEGKITIKKSVIR